MGNCCSSSSYSIPRRRAQRVAPVYGVVQVTVEVDVETVVVVVVEVIKSLALGP